MVTIAVLTISDSASRNAQLDRSGPVICSTLLALPNYHLAAARIVPDDIVLVRSAVNTWVDDHVDWIITTGGTGFGARDVTPEVRSLLSLGLIFLI